MKKEFLLNIFFLIAVNVIIKPFYVFGIDRTVQNRVSAEEYGIYFSIMSFTFLLQIVNDFGIYNYNNSTISKHKQLLSKYFSNIIILKMILGFIYTILTLLIGILLGYTSNYPCLLVFLMANQIIISLNFYLRSNVSGLGKYRLDSFISVLDRLILIPICIVLLWVEPFRSQFEIQWFVIAQTISLLIVSMVLIFILRNEVLPFKFKFNKIYLLYLLKQSGPYALTIFLMTIYTRLDPVMLEQLLPDGKLQAGIYASAYRVLDAVNMIGFLFASLLLPMYSRLIANKQSVDDLLHTSLKLILGFSSILSFSIFLYKNEIVDILYHKQDAIYGEVMGVLLLSFVIFSCIYIYSTLLTANNSLRKMNKIFVFSILINVVANLILIPIYKSLGASIATLLTQGFTLTGIIILCHKEFNLPFQKSMFVRLMLFFISFIGISILIKNSGLASWYVLIVLTGFVGLILVFLFKLIEFSFIKNIIFTKK
jgi:O-antigen/teichoic acid export membrane protein